MPLAFLVEVVDALFQAVEIGQHQLGLDGLDIGQWRDLAFDMGDVGILEAAHHMRDRVDLADGGEKLVAEALALGGAAHQAGDIDKGQPGRDDLRRFARSPTSLSSRGSGTATSPTLGSMVQNG